MINNIDTGNSRLMKIYKVTMLPLLFHDAEYTAPNLDSIFYECLS